jgi:biotin synthase
LKINLQLKTKISKRSKIVDFEKMLENTAERPTLKKCLSLLEKANSYDELRKLFDFASKLRDENFGRTLKLDSFVYPVKKCVMERYCIYCSNYVEEFRLEPLSIEEFCRAVEFIKDCGMKRVTLEGGYNPDNSKIPILIRISRKAGFEVALDIYPIAENELWEFKSLGASEVYASLEIADEKIFKKFKPGESLEERLTLARKICRNKIDLSSTLLIGLPETDEELWIKGILLLREFDCLKHLTISGFNPVFGTPLENSNPASPVTVAKFVALARILLPDRDISAAGSVSLQSLPLMLIAGANRAYLGAYVCRARTRKGFAGELDEVFKPEYEAIISDGLVFADPSRAVERICRELGFEVL